MTASTKCAEPSDLSVRLYQQGLVAAFGHFALAKDDMQAILDEASRVAAAGLDARFAKVLRHPTKVGCAGIFGGVNAMSKARNLLLLRQHAANVLHRILTGFFN